MARSTFLTVALATNTLLIAGLALAQNFVRVTDPSNEAATDFGEINYNGAAWVDYDNDGDEDLFTCRDRMYRNDGGGIFVRVDLGMLNIPGLGNGCSWADYDNDGDFDVAIGSNPTTAVYRNDGNDIFTALDEGDINWQLDHRAFSCAWGDYDSDGNVDLIVVHPGGWMGLPILNNMVFHNDGPPNYLFTRDYTNDVAMGIAVYTVGTFSDYDLDGDQDFFIACGPIQNVGVDYLYQNQLAETGDPYLERILEGTIATTERDGQNINWIDYDNDTDLDCYITNYQGGNLSGMANDLYRNDGELGFTEITTGTIVTDVQVSLGSCWADFDNDGDLDCFVANENWFNRYYRNNGHGTFTSLNNPATLTFGLFRTPVTADYDEDGDLDLFVSGVDSFQAFFRNDLNNGNHFLKVKCVGVTSNKAAIGTRVRILATIADESQWQQREINSQNSFNGHNSYIVHFGLRTAEVVDSIEIYWPSGTEQAWGGIAADQYLIIAEDSVFTGTQDRPISLPAEFALSAYPNPFNPTTTLSFTLPQRGSVAVTIHNTLGREVQRFDLGNMNSGQHKLELNGAAWSAGIYFVTLDTPARSATAKLLLLR